MVSYYVYGRGKEGYIKYNPDYSKSEEDMYFLKMADYTLCSNDIQDMPEKIFCYRLLSEKNGDCTVMGQTSFVKGLSTRIY